MAGDRGLAFVVIGLIGVSSVWILSARHTPPPRASHSRQAASSPADARFLANAAQQTLAETLLGELAEQKGSKAVRQLAVGMTGEYRRVNFELRRLAAAEGVQLPGEINGENRATYDYLASLGGDAFDRNYTFYALRDHHVAAADLVQEATGGIHPELKRFASGRLPLLRQRLRLIEDTAAQFGVTSPIE